MKKTISKKVLVAFLLILVSAPFIFYNFVRIGAWGTLPGINEIKHIQNLRGSRVYASGNEELGRYYIQDRTPVSLQQVSPKILQALIATEDQRFYNHKGTDYRSLIRVIIKTLLLQNRSSGGGSTITQQLAKNLYPRVPARLLYYPVNKTREMIIAGRIEEVYTKDEILELYLNTVSFGEDVYGVESASNRFFNKKASELNIEEAAVLVGMLKATTSYNPIIYPEKSRERRNVVFGQLNKSGVIADDSLEYMCNLPLVTDYNPPNNGVAQYFLMQVKKQAEQVVEAYNKQWDTTYQLNQSGLKIKTTLDLNMQMEAEKAVLEHMKALQQVFDKHWAKDRFWNEHQELLNHELEDVSHNRTREEIDKTRKLKLFSYDDDTLIQGNTIDSLKYHLQKLHAGFVSVEPFSGQIKTWVGGIDYQYFPYDHVSYQAKRQVGSVFKPILYAAALENGISPCSYYSAKQVAYEVEEGTWTPSNSGNEYDRKFSMEGSLEESINTISVKILNDVGIEPTIRLAKNLGIRANLPPVPSIALGTPSVSLLEMVTAYCVFTNGGYSVAPYLIHSIEDSAGHIIYQYESPKQKQIISEETSQTIIYLLQNVVNDGTASSIRSTFNLGNDIGGKTGTTQNNADGWFIGVSPKLVSGTWVGGTYPEISFRETSLGQGATMALPVFAKFLGQLNSNPRFNSYTHSQFKPLPQSLARKLDCDPFKEPFELFQWLFGKKKDQKTQIGIEVIKNDTLKKGNLFRKIGNLFKRKQKSTNPKE